MSRRLSVEEKLAALRRVAVGESPRVVAAALGVSHVSLYRWQARFSEAGENGLATARRRELRALAEPEGVRARMAALEHKVAQQALELDFFKTALQHVEASRRASIGPGATASMPGSGRGRSGKAGRQD